MMDAKLQTLAIGIRNGACCAHGYTTGLVWSSMKAHPEITALAGGILLGASVKILCKERQEEQVAAPKERQPVPPSFKPVSVDNTLVLQVASNLVGNLEKLDKNAIENLAFKWAINLAESKTNTKAEEIFRPILSHLFLNDVSPQVKAAAASLLQKLGPGVLTYGKKRLTLDSGVIFKELSSSTRMGERMTIRDRHCNGFSILKTEIARWNTYVHTNSQKGVRDTANMGDPEFFLTNFPFLSLLIDRSKGRMESLRPVMGILYSAENLLGVDAQFLTANLEEIKTAAKAMVDGLNNALGQDHT